MTRSGPLDEFRIGMDTAAAAASTNGLDPVSCKKWHCAIRTAAQDISAKGNYANNRTARQAGRSFPVVVMLSLPCLTPFAPMRRSAKDFSAEALPRTTDFRQL